MDNEKMDLLFDDRLAPITTSLGFIEDDCSSVVKTFIKWRREVLKHNKNFKKIIDEPVSENLEQVLKCLLPLKLIQSTRYLFIPTTGRWTAFLDNNYRGTDPTAISYLPMLLRSRSVWVVAIPHTLQPIGTPRRGRQGALIIEVWGHKNRGWDNIIRKVRLENDAGKWKFQQEGEPFQFEETERYQARRLRDRFDFNMMNRYLKELGLSPFEEDFYLPANDRNAILVEIQEKPSNKNIDITLEEARKLNGIDEWDEQLFAYIRNL